MSCSRNNALCFVVGLVVLIGTGCGGKGGETPEPEATSGGDLALYERPIESTDVERGKGLFDDFCGDCHPNGEEDTGPSLIAEPHTPGEIRRQIREGGGKMRPFAEKRLSDADMESILAWLASVNAVK